MTLECANALGPYFETLNQLNKNLVKCCETNLMEVCLDYVNPLQTVIETIPKLIPYAYDRKDQKYIISQNDGLMEFNDELLFLQGAYEKILAENYDFLNDVKHVRNKLEHKMHEVKFSSSIGDAYPEDGKLSSFQIIYSVGNNKEKVVLESEKFIILTRQLNCLFSDLQDQLRVSFENSDKSDHPYFKRMMDYDFKAFNKRYED